VTRPFHESSYLPWARRRAPIRFNLARSGVPRLALDRLSPPLDYLLTTDTNDDGWPPLLERLAARYGVTRAHVVTTHGCSMANHLVFAALVDAGDDVLIETPGYEPLARLAGYRGARVVPLLRREEDAWRVDPDAVRRAMTPRTRLVVLSNLHNPTGARDDDATVAAIAECANRAGAHLLVDEVYLEFLYADGATTAARLADNVVTTRSVTKAFGLDTLRLGWVIAEPVLADRIRRLNDLFTPGTAHPSERLTALALDGAAEILSGTNALLARNIALVDAFVAAHPLLSWIRPPAGTVGFLRVEGIDTAALAEHLHRDHDVAVVPGHFFAAPGYLRIGWGLESDLLSDALDAFGRGLGTHP